MAWHIDLQLANKEDLEKIGKQSQGQRTDLLSDSDKKSPHDTRKEIAKAANTSTGMVGMAEVVRKQAPDLWEKAKRDEVTVSAAYKTIKKKKAIQKLDSTKAADRQKLLPNVKGKRLVHELLLVCSSPILERAAKGWAIWVS